MKVVILAGGRGSRLGDATLTRPKPMLEVGGRPLLWHVMRHYFHYGYDDFVVAAGYRADVIHDYFSRALLPWRVTIIDTGEHTDTGGRIRRLSKHLAGQDFMLTFGDAVADVDLRKLLEFHRAHGRLATVTAVHPPPRFGYLQIDNNHLVTKFSEKTNDTSWVNGGFFVMQAKILESIDNDAASLERDVLPRIVSTNELMAFHHEGYWQCMDFPNEYELLEQTWRSGSPPWRIWQED